MCEHCTRRQFIGATAVTGLAVAGTTGAFVKAASPATKKHQGKCRICVVFTGNPQPADRNWGADAEQIGLARAALADAEKALGNVELVVGQSGSPQATLALLSKAGPEAPVLAINMENFALTRVIQPVLDAGRPLLVFSLPASGHDWMYAPRWREAGHPVTLMATSDYGELERALRLLRVPPLMRQARILLFPPARGTQRACIPSEVKKRLGPDVLAVEQQRLDRMIASADDDAVRAETEAWTRGAEEILEPTRVDIEKAARVSVALDRLVEEEQADGLAVGTCMGWLPRGFPCLGFTRLRDRGIPAACEGDMDSLLTMMLMEYAFDRPGFQGNATFDTSRNALWTAHCTAPLKMDGRSGREAPYMLRGHSEVAGSGCVPEVKYRLGQVITRTKLVGLDTILASTGKIIEVPGRSRHGCRTQIVTEVEDATKMAASWSHALDTEDAMTLLHRVVFYDDHMQDLRYLADLMGLSVVREG